MGVEVLEGDSLVGGCERAVVPPACTRRESGDTTPCKMTGVTLHSERVCGHRLVVEAGECTSCGGLQQGFPDERESLLNL